MLPDAASPVESWLRERDVGIEFKSEGGAQYCNAARAKLPKPRSALAGLSVWPQPTRGTLSSSRTIYFCIVKNH